MSDHLPECGYKPCNCGYEDDPRGNWAGHLRCSHVPCICDRLRACEKRVTDQVNREWAEISVDDEVRIWNEALDAAREAVAAAYDDERYAHSDDWGVPVVYKDSMLAAIDALRGER